MLGPIIVSSVGISLPIVAGLWLAPKRNSELGRSVPIDPFHRCLQLLARVASQNTHSASTRTFPPAAMSDAD